MNKPHRNVFRNLITISISLLFILTVTGVALFFNWNETHAQVKTRSKKKSTVKKVNPNIFKEHTFEGKRVKPVIQATRTFAQILDYEKNEYVPPEMDYVLNSKGKRPRNPPAMEMPAPPSSIFKQNPKMFFDYEKIINSSNIAPAVASPTPNDDFTALPDGLTSIPPDTHGAVGPNHLMTALNTQVRFQNKTGGIIGTVSINSFFASVGGGSGTFDPRVLYDQLSNRWITVAVDDAAAATSKVLIAVSQTDDPTGTWNFYGYDHDATNIDWADFPMVGYNKDWIAVGINDFTVAGNAFGGAQMYIFDKSTLYSGAAVPTVLQHDIGTTFSNVHQPAETFDSSLDTLYVLQRWSSSGGSVRIYTITGTAASPTFTATTLFPSTTPWNSSVVAAPQSGSAVTITNNDTRMQSVVYRNGSLWAAHSIGMPTGTANRTSIQWWEINPATGTTIQAGKIDDSTGTNFYAFPSIAVNAANQVLIGYSAFSATTFASAAYSYRGVTDATATTQDPITYKAGVDCYRKTFSGSTNRWGDYSRVAVDPVDDSTFWALQEYAETSVGTPCVGNSGRWGTWWAKLIPPCTGTATGNWNATGTWGCGNVPTGTDDAVIATGQNVTLNVNPTAASITVNTGGTLTMSGNRTSPVDIELNGTLDLTNGTLDMGANTLKVGCGGSITGASATGFVIGNVEKEFCTTGPFTFPVGENGYSPMTANITNLATNPTTLTVDAVDGVLSGLDTSHSATRNWNLSGTGLTADLSFTYLDADVVGNEANYRVFRKIGAATPTDQCGSPCVNTGTNTATATGQSSFSQWGVGALAPTAAGTVVGGRVLTSKGRALRGATVSITNQNGQIRRAVTNQFGYFRFQNIAVGQTYTFNIRRKGYSFNPRLITVEERITNLSFRANE